MRNCTRSFLHRLGLITVVLWIAGAAFGQTLEFVPYNDPVYDQLDRLYTHRLISLLPNVRPYTQAQVVGYLSEARAELIESSVSPALKENLRQSIVAQLQRFEKPKPGLLYFADEQSQISFNLRIPVSLGATLSMTDFSNSIPELPQSFRASLSFGPHVFIGLDQQQVFTYWEWTEQPYTYFDAPPLMDNIFHVFLPAQDNEVSNYYNFHVPGEPSIVYGANQTNQASVDFGVGRIDMNRQALSWGKGATGQLQLSSTAKPYENLNLVLPILDFAYFSWMTGFLQDVDPTSGFADRAERRLITAHRVEVQPFSWLKFAIFENVLYSMRLELGYLNPLGLYFLNEVRLGDQDDKLGGAELQVRLGPVQMYTTFFADDWTFSKLLSLNYFNNIFGFNAGAVWYDVFPGFTLSGEFVYLSHWMYTHKTDNVSKHFNTHLGHPLDPNAYLVQIGAKYDVDPSLQLSGSILVMENGRGTIDDDPDYPAEMALHGVSRIEDLRYSFLSKGFGDQFPVEQVFQISLGARYHLWDTRLSFEGSYTFEYLWNKNWELGVSQANHVLELTLGYDLYM